MCIRDRPSARQAGRVPTMGLSSSTAPSIMSRCSRCTGRGYLDTKLSYAAWYARGAHEAVLLGQPLLVVEVDEGLDGRAQLGHRAVEAAVDDLLFEGLEEALGDAVGLGLLDEGVARFQPPEAHLVAEVLGDVLRAVVHAQGESPACVRGHAAELREQSLRHRLQRGEAITALADVAADDLAVEVVDGREDPAHALLGGEHARTVGAPHPRPGVGGDPAVVADAVTLAHAARGEQAVLAHEAQDAPPRGAHAADAQAVSYTHLR